MTVIQVESAVDLSTSQVEKLTEIIKKTYGERSKVNFSVDPSLIGGLRIVSDQKTVDLTLAAKLSQLNNTLINSL